MAEHLKLRLSVQISMEIRLDRVTLFYQGPVKSYFTKVKPQIQKPSATSWSLHSGATHSLAKTNATVFIHIWRSTYQRKFQHSPQGLSKQEWSNLKWCSRKGKVNISKYFHPMPNVSLLHLNIGQPVFTPWNNAVRMNPRNFNVSDSFSQPPITFFPVSLELAKENSVIEWYRTCALLARRWQMDYKNFKAEHLEHQGRDSGYLNSLSLPRRQWHSDMERISRNGVTR